MNQTPFTAAEVTELRGDLESLLRRTQQWAQVPLNQFARLVGCAERELERYGAALTDAEVASFLQTPPALSPEDERALAEAKASFPHSLKQLSARLLAERKLAALRTAAITYRAEAVRFMVNQVSGLEFDAASVSFLQAINAADSHGGITDITDH